MSYQKNWIVEWLLSHAYGQGGTVAVPWTDTIDRLMPRGEFPPGIEDMLEYLVKRYSGWSDAGSQEIDWCFLVGGPGNGKSEALRGLANMLKVHLPPRKLGQPVPRAVPASWPEHAHSLQSGLEIAFINDASVPRVDSALAGEPGSLFKDLSEGLDRLFAGRSPVALFCNVNRGILVEEAGYFVKSDPSFSAEQERFAAEIIRWLAAPPSPDTESSDGTSPLGIETVVPIDPLAPQYGQFRINLMDFGASRNLIVHAVFLDVLSLLEPRPGAGGTVVDFSQPVPKVSPYRTLGELISAEATRDSTTAGKLVRSLVLPVHWLDEGCRDPVTGTVCDAFQTCPFAQNSRWLQTETLRHRFLDTLRGAEVAAGRRLTYRDLLGHVSLAILGQPEDSWLSGIHPCHWSAQQHQALRGASSKGTAATLVSHRIYASLFRVPEVDPNRWRFENELQGDSVYRRVKLLWKSTRESPRLQSYERAFGAIDPARDTDAWNGMRARVLNAVESLDVEAPSAQALQWSELPQEAHSLIEEICDQVLRDEIATELARGTRASGNRVRVLRRWRSILFLQQVGTALGHIGFGTAIQAWLAEQENALRRDPRLKLGDGIRNLVLPSGDGGRVFLAPLRPRTYCIVGELPKTTLLVSININDLAVVMVAQGDTLIAEVQMNQAMYKKAPRLLASLVVDLPVAREALLHAQGNQRSFTEIGYTAFARIERARASLIGRAQIKSLPVHFTDELEQLFKLSGNPVGPAPLRVQRV